MSETGCPTLKVNSATVSAKPGTVSGGSGVDRLQPTAAVTSTAQRA